jgi:hypothetical protein
MIDEHHPTLSPSALPMLEQCPCFERAEDAAAIALEPREPRPTYRDRGTEQHLVFEHLLRGHEMPTDTVLTPIEKEQVQWAADYVKANITAEFPMELEQRLVLMDDYFNIITFGTADVTNGPHLFDYKSGDMHNYWLQVACYGLMQMDRLGVDNATVTVLFARHKKAHQVDLTQAKAQEKVFAVINSVIDPERKPKANPYCKWCCKVMTCPAVKKVIGGVEAGHYKIEDPVELSEALKKTVILIEWAARVQAHAKQMAMAGTEIPYFYLKPRQGAREIVDVKRAYELSGLPPDQFLKLCNVAVGAVEDAIATHDSISKSAAKKEVNSRLGEVIRRRPPTVSLAQTQQTEPTET